MQADGRDEVGVGSSTLCTAGAGPARASGTERSESAKSVTPATTRVSPVPAQMWTGVSPVPVWLG